VRIDRPEDGDTPADAPAREAGRDAGPLSDPAARMAEQAWYRGTIEKVYAAARDAWAEAVPALRAAWTEHERHHPERTRLTPRTRPDGSWVDGGTRELTPEHNAEAAKACADTRDEGREIVLPAMRRVEAADPGRRLAGLKNMLKGEDRLKEKIADYLRAPGVTVREALGMVPDAVRFTLTYSTERYADGVRADVERLTAEGFELMKLKNLWTNEQYKGINSQWRRAETGLRFEMQFHTPESLEAKELTHKAYERLRGSQATSPAERRELENFQRRVNVLIVTPPGTAEIKDFPENDNG